MQPAQMEGITFFRELGSALMTVTTIRITEIALTICTQQDGLLPVCMKILLATIMIIAIQEGLYKSTGKV